MPSPHKRVSDLEPLKPAEVAVPGQEFRDPMLEAQSCNVRVVHQIACGSRLAHGSIQHGGVPPRLSKQNERGRSQHSFEVCKGNLKRNRRMKDARMSHHPEEFVNTGPRDGPGQGSFGERLQNLERCAMMLARLDLSVDEDVGVNGLHALVPFHQIEQGIPVQEVDPGEFGSLPAPKTQLERLTRACHQGAAKKIIDDYLESPAFLGRFLLQLKQKLVLNRQSGSPHMQKHMGRPSICQARRLELLRLLKLDKVLKKANELVASLKTAKASRMNQSNPPSPSIDNRRFFRF
jgi:hypothetical protein